MQVIDNEEFLDYLPNKKREELFISKAEEIDKMREECNYELALAICDKEENAKSSLINYKKVLTLMDMERYNEALDITNNIKYQDMLAFTLCRINILIDLDKLEKALEECNKEEYRDNYRIQSRKIKVLKLTARYRIEDTNLYEALEICNRFRDVPKIQYQKIDILILLKRYDEAMNYCDFLGSDNVIIEAKKMSILMALGKYLDSLKVFNDSKYASDPILISQKIKTLVSFHKATKDITYLQEALAVCNTGDYSRNLIIQSQKTTILIYLEKYEEALAVCNSNGYSDYAQTQAQKAKILIALYEKNKDITFLKQALEIYNRYPENKYMKKSRRRVLYMINSIKNNTTISEYLTRVYCNDITREEIEKLDITNWEKDLLITALYEKTNKKAGEVHLKRIKPNYSEDREKTKTINNLLNRLMSKKTYYDITIYGKLLGCGINPEQAINKLSKVSEKTKPVITSIKPVISKVKENNPNQRLKVIKLNDNKEIKPITSEVLSTEVKPTDIIMPVEKEESISTPKTKKVLIRDLFKEEVLEIRKYLYLQMADQSIQSKAVKAWDKFEIMIEKDSSDKENLKRMITLLNNLEKNCNSISINVDQDKYNKLLTK